LNDELHGIWKQVFVAFSDASSRILQQELRVHEVSDALQYPSIVSFVMGGYIIWYCEFPKNVP
jgi:hypothetical protein